MRWRHAMSPAGSVLHHITLSPFPPSTPITQRVPRTTPTDNRHCGWGEEGWIEDQIIFFNLPVSHSTLMVAAPDATHSCWP
ncbi:hypothetical protein E2C01_053028 [Portunus trituberculatus]|uniref:Uncharacterized protein n=1 Tax=Portunus trituberculatus TaxID=210409 RepID=A0A5B7GN89_PORTR|nr:hypothetical protein [Portunus trituberculatus]